METSEKRVHTRAQYFLLRTPGDNNPVPVYSLRDADDTNAIPALVVDMSEGGLQLLTTTAVRLEDTNYRISIVTEDEAVIPQQLVHPVWTRPDGVNNRTGCAFVNPVTAQDAIAQLLKDSEMGLLRCVLHPVG